MRHRNNNYQNLISAILKSSFVLAFIWSCGPQKINSQKKMQLDEKHLAESKPQQQDKLENSPQIEFETIPQYISLDKIPDQYKNDYEAPKSYIQNNDKKLHIGYLKFSEIKSHFRRDTGLLKITGSVTLMASDLKTPLLTTPFTLEGQKEDQETYIILKKSEVSKHSENFIFKGVATCIDQFSDSSENSQYRNSSDEIIYDCANAIVDFIAVYKQKHYYTEQFKIQGLTPKPQTKKSPLQTAQREAVKENRRTTPTHTPSNPQSQTNTQTKAPTPSAQNHKQTPDQTLTQSRTNEPAVPENENELDPQNGLDLKPNLTYNDMNVEEEGEEEDVPEFQGRYVGRAHEIDLQDLLSDDEKQTQTKSATSSEKAPQSQQNSERRQSVKAPQASSPRENPPQNERRSENPPRSEQQTAASTRENLPQVQENISSNSAQKFIFQKYGLTQNITQARGSQTRSGSLINATSYKDLKSKYSIDHLLWFGSLNYYGTQETFAVLLGLAENYNQLYNEKIYISRISAQRGGKLSPSKSHQNGLDIDIAYPITKNTTNFPIVSTNGQNITHRSYRPDKFFTKLRFLAIQNIHPIFKVFVDRSVIKNLCHYVKENNLHKGQKRNTAESIFRLIQHVDGHRNHYHVRLSCTKPTCVNFPRNIKLTCDL